MTNNGPINKCPNTKSLNTDKQITFITERNIAKGGQIITLLLNKQRIENNYEHNCIHYVDKCNITIP